MKCIKAIRPTKDVELGEIKRVDDKTASSMVGSYWQYVAKSEWKALTRKPKQTEQPIKENEENKEKKPYKKGQKNKKS